MKTNFVKHFAKLIFSCRFVDSQHIRRYSIMSSKITIFSPLILGLLMSISSCKPPSLKKADDAKARLQYKYAGDLYTQLGSKLKDKDEAMRAKQEAAVCYRMANEYEKAIKAYEKILKKEPKNTEALYQIGSLKMKIADNKPEELREAREFLKKYLEEVPNDERALNKVAAIDSAESWRLQAPKSRFQVTNMKVLNTKASDYSPMIASKKDDMLFFTTNREGGVAKKKIYGWTGFGFDDLWYAKAKKGKKDKNGKPTMTWEKPILTLGTINTKFNDGTACFDRKYGTIYYTQCNGPDGKAKNCKIFTAKFNGTEWAEEQMLDFCMEDTFFYGHPCLSEDGKKMYFASDRPDGYGGYDIWMCTYNQRAKSWGEPVNLGENINTEKNEMFPYLNFHDGQLYFSSNGYIGMGGLDIFRSEGSGTEWTEPENLRAPLNSGGDDFGITFDNTNPDHGYFTSNREGGKGSDDIYEFKVQPLVIELEGYVYECLPNSMNNNLSKPLANSTILITNDRDSTKIELKTNDKGYYYTKLKEKTTYEIACSNRELYYFDAETAQKTTKGIKVSTMLRQDFCMKSQIIEEVVPIYYDLDRAEIRPDAAKVLDERILPLLLKYPKLRLELGSHTDCRSSYDYNIDLSQRRADSAVAYLVRKGIDPRRVPAKGYGESQLVNDCKCEGGIKVPCTEAQHQENRRTTIKTLDVNFDPKVAAVNSGDKNNVNSKPIIVKMTKNDKGNFVSSASNGVESNGPSSIVPGADITMSINELKNLITKGAITQADLVGVTLAEITSGKIKPGATVKLKTLRIGAKDRGNTLTDVVVKIAAITTPFAIGTDALTKYNGTVNMEEGEISFKNINAEALKDGPVNSTISPGGTTGTSTTNTPKPADTVSLDDYKQVTMIEENGDMLIPTMVNDNAGGQVNWKYDAASRKIEVSEDVAIQLLESKAIEKGDFEDGESIKLKNGTKVRSNVFVIAKLQIGDVVLENVKVTINSKLESGANFGGASTLFKKLNAVVKNKVLFMKPKEKKAPKD